MYPADSTVTVSQSHSDLVDIGELTVLCLVPDDTKGAYKTYDGVEILECFLGLQAAAAQHLHGHTWHN